MDRIGEVCIIHTIDDYAPALFLKEFMKWTGMSYFEYAYHEENDEMNKLLNSENNQFDVILYINDTYNIYKTQYSHLAGICIDVTFSGIWESENDNIMLDVAGLKKVWKDLLQEMDPEDTVLDIIFAELAEVYCEKRLLWKILNNKYSMIRNITETNGWQTERELKAEREEWKGAVGRLEEFKEQHPELQDSAGMAHFEYAIVYCLRKIYELDKIFGEQDFNDLHKMFTRLNAIYSINKEFYMAENLKAKIAMMHSEYDLYAYSYMKNCTEMCKNEACNSFHYYRWAKVCEKIGKKNTAMKIFRQSYEKNNLNFRALLKIAVDEMNRESYVQAASYIHELLRLLHLGVEGERFKINLNKLPALELEYACKCFIILGMIEERYWKDYANAEKYYNKAEDVRISVSANEYLKQMYKCEEENIIASLSQRLYKGVLERKLEIVGGIKQ